MNDLGFDRVRWAKTVMALAKSDCMFVLNEMLADTSIHAIDFIKDFSKRYDEHKNGRVLQMLEECPTNYHACPECDCAIEPTLVGEFLYDGSEWSCDECGAGGVFQEFTHEDSRYPERFYAPVKWSDEDE